MRKVEHALERFMFNSRWMLVPIYVGLVLTIGLLLVKFYKEFVHLVPEVLYGEGGTATVVGVLSLIDVALVANLLLIIIFAGYENFVSRIDVTEDHEKPSWMGTVDFSDLKIKLIGSIVAISGIELLRLFVKVTEVGREELMWKVIIHVTLVVSGVLFATMDRIGGKHHH
jgi:TIGR00645 family protein